MIRSDPYGDVMGMWTADPTTASDDNAVGTVAWSDVLNVLLTDDSMASAVLLLGQQSHYIRVGGYNFFVPDAATVDGIRFSPERSANILSGAEDQVVKAVRSGTVVGDNKAQAGSWPSSDETVDIGGATDLWGATWTPAQVNSIEFVLSVSALLGVTAKVDHTPATVWWTTTNTPGALGRIKVGNGMGCSI